MSRLEPQLHERLLGAIARGCGRLRPRPLAVVVFGSVARGARNFRDVDLLCVAARERDKNLIHDAVASAFGQVQREFKVPVSAVVASSTELSAPKLEAVTREAHRDGVLVFGTAPAELSGMTIWKGAKGSSK